MEDAILELVLNTPWVKTALVTVGVWVAAGLALAGAIHTLATGVLRPLARLTPSKRDDWVVARLVWWSDCLADILREWSFGRWVKGWERAKRMLEDRKKSLPARRTD